jgi:hypothetical protein
MTKAQFISDVELKINQSAPSDDSELSKDQVAYIGSYFLNGLVAVECNSHLTHGQQIPSVYVTRATIEVPELEEEDDVVEANERIFVDTPAILTLNNDMGVLAVSTEDLTDIQKADIQSIQLFKNMRFSKPSAENLVYYRAGNKLFLYGIKAVDIPFSHIILDYVPQQDILTMEESDTILCSDLVYPSVVSATVDELKRQMYGTQPDVMNDGSDVKSTSYHLGIQKSGQ